MGGSWEGGFGRREEFWDRVEMFGGGRKSWGVVDVGHDLGNLPSAADGVPCYNHQTALYLADYNTRFYTFSTDTYYKLMS